MNTIQHNWPLTSKLLSVNQSRCIHTDTRSPQHTSGGKDALLNEGTLPCLQSDNVPKDMSLVHVLMQHRSRDSNEIETI